MDQSEIPEISALPREAEPPAGLEDQIVATLRQRDLLKRRAGGVWIWRVAAAIVLVAVGFALGYRPAQKQPTFVLLLRQGAEERTHTSDVEQERRVAEYRAWARDLRTRGISINGMKLQSSMQLLPPGNVREDEKIAGFFWLNAKSLEDALAVARSCPHLKYGGVIEVRKIEGV